MFSIQLAEPLTVTVPPEALAGRATGRRAVSARRLTGGEPSTMHEVALEGGAVIIRRHSDPAVWRHARWLAEVG